jgi:hypothetical protein
MNEATLPLILGSFPRRYAFAVPLVPGALLPGLKRG